MKIIWPEHATAVCELGSVKLLDLVELTLHRELKRPLMANQAGGDERVGVEAAATLVQRGECFVKHLRCLNVLPAPRHRGGKSLGGEQALRIVTGSQAAEQRPRSAERHDRLLGPLGIVERVAERAQEQSVPLIVNATDRFAQGDGLLQLHHAEVKVT